MNLEGLLTYKRLIARLPAYDKNAAGKTVAMVTPDKALTLTATNTMAPGETTWDKVSGKPVMFPTTWAMITDRPALFSGAYGDLTDKPNLSPVAASGAYSDLSGQPTLFSGAYADLTGLPALFDGKWTSLIGKPTTSPTTWAQVADKPVLFDGSWNSLTDRPSAYPTTWTQVAGKPSFFSGSYNDLTDKPAIPSMPSLAKVASTGAYADLTGLPALFNGTWAALTGKPTTLAGYGITDAATASALATKADSSAVKRTDTYTGKTDANGLFTVAYPTPFSVVPSVQPEPPAMANQVWVKVSSTTTGFSLRLVQRNVVNLLNIEVLLGATVNVNAGDARVVVIAA